MIARARALWFGLLLAGVSLAILFSLFSSGFFPVQADETDVAWVAKQTATGRVPYRDFFTFIPPLVPYGLGAYLKLTGPSLAALRYLSVAWLLLVTLLVYALLLRSRMPAWWAAGTALSFPALFLPYWPVSSHHWFATGFGLMALLAAVRPNPSALHWFTAGLLAGLSGLCLQTEGALVCTLLALLWLLSAPGERRRTALALALGVALPLALFLALLVAAGSLRDAYLCLVEWPAQNYKQPGGFNDVDGVAFLTDLWKQRFPSGGGVSRWLPLLLLSAAYALPPLALATASWSPAWTSAARVPDRAWAFSTAGLGLVALAYLAGREDWTHLVFWVPLILVLSGHGLDWASESLQPRLFKGWILLTLVLTAISWATVWAVKPPDPGRIGQADRDFVSKSLPAVLGELPRATEKGLPVLYLSRHGSGLYFYWAPVPPPLDWVEPPSMRYNAPWEYALVARFAVEHEVPYIVTPESNLRPFLDEPSAVATLLRTRYRYFKKTPWGVILERTPHAKTSP
jgi:hypothetical protein